MSLDTFGTRESLNHNGKNFEIFNIQRIAGSGDLPFSLKILLENLVRTEDGANVTSAQIRALADWNPAADPDTEIQFTPARVIMQDFTQRDDSVENLSFSRDGCLHHASIWSGKS